MDASKAFKKSRTTIYEALKNGELSRDHDGLIDLSELKILLTELSLKAP